MWFKPVQLEKKWKAVQNYRGGSQNSVCSPCLHDGYIQAVCVICYNFLCWAVLCNLDMTPLMVITVLCAAVAEESDLREQDLSHESEGSL